MTVFILHGLKPTLSAVFCEPAFVSACAHTGLLPCCMISSHILYARYDASPWCLCASAVSTPISTSSGLTALENATAAKLPSVLVPLPTAADDHQTTNAEAIAINQAGHVFKQKEFSAEALTSILENLINDQQKLSMMSERAAKISIVDASKRLADAIEKEIIFAEK